MPASVQSYKHHIPGSYGESNRRIRVTARTGDISNTQAGQYFLGVQVYPTRKITAIVTIVIIVLKKNMESSPLELKTLQGKPASILGLGGNLNLEASCISMAYEAGINYYFFDDYHFCDDMLFHSLLEGLRMLISVNREQIIIAVGSVYRSHNKLRDYLDQVRKRLNVDMIDVFLVGYVSPTDDMKEIQGIFDELHNWKEGGSIRYAGVSTHNRSLALELLNSGQCDVLMHRYNMAHRGAEEKVLPTAYQAGIPVVSFTSTRWGSLLKGHSHWQGKIPNAADCYRYVLQNPAVSLALISPKNNTELQENMSVFNSPTLTNEEIKYWEEYGKIIYGNGQNSFETKWL